MFLVCWCEKLIVNGFISAYIDSNTAIDPKDKSIRPISASWNLDDLSQFAKDMAKRPSSRRPSRRRPFLIRPFAILWTEARNATWHFYFSA